MKLLVISAGALCSACSSASHTVSIASSQAIFLGTQADIDNAALLAKKCNLRGTTAGKLNSSPALFIERAALLRLKPDSLTFNCFMLGLLSAEFSDQLGIVGGEVGWQP